MKDRHYLRYDGTETEQSFSAAEGRAMAAVGRIHDALAALDKARAALSAAAEEVRREVRRVETPKQTRADFEKFWNAGGVTADAYKVWICRPSKRPKAVLQRKHMRLVASQSPSVGLSEKPQVRRKHFPPEPPDVA
jgi:hypothetical protein